MPDQTPSQTIGPFFAMLIASDDDEAVLAPPGTPGEPVVLRGRIVDGTGSHLEDALLEVWQADADGRYRHPADQDEVPGDDAGFTGFGRVKGGFEDGSYELRTVRPGRVPAPDGGEQAPHLSLCLQGRGLLNPLFTRVYFDDEDDANDADPVLGSVPADRRGTLVATREGSDDDGATVYRFDIVVQGEDETVFLDV